ncbi:hypothetical protein CANCADRAFT_84174 [Tortispora caseinolytica NRRL Y-17796]|uniref:Uncharacterized protein n=1 Tax=Tortispora caseinolytica NRRL Y-17796 TaxID=767744 RepID=A0A1E4TKR6_9ASCO|nr:hypothetical protein CANCADRAFT_84174 [Tortispora caseinolytica NRRL Y-17796]
MHRTSGTQKAAFLINILLDVASIAFFLLASISHSHVFTILSGFISAFFITHLVCQIAWVVSPQKWMVYTLACICAMILGFGLSLICFSINEIIVRSKQSLLLEKGALPVQTMLIVLVLLWAVSLIAHIVLLGIIWSSTVLATNKSFAPSMNSDKTTIKSADFKVPMKNYRSISSLGSTIKSKGKLIGSLVAHPIASIENLKAAREAQAQQHDYEREILEHLRASMSVYQRPYSNRSASSTSASHNTPIMAEPVYISSTIKKPYGQLNTGNNYDIQQTSNMELPCDARTVSSGSRRMNFDNWDTYSVRDQVMWTMKQISDGFFRDLTPRSNTSSGSRTSDARTSGVSSREVSSQFRDMTSSRISSVNRSLRDFSIAETASDTSEIIEQMNTKPAVSFKPGNSPVGLMANKDYQTWSNFETIPVARPPSSSVYIQQV